MRLAQCALCLALLAGCVAEKKPEPDKTPPAPAPEVVLADKLLELGRLSDATIAAVDIARKNPDATGLSDLQYRIAAKLADERMAAAEKRLVPTLRASTADAKTFGNMPDMYRTKKHVMGENAPLRTVPTDMQNVLTNPVSVNLSDADVSSIVKLIGETANINMIADAAVGINPDTGEPRTVSIYAEDTPLIEILDYVGRNLGVNFSVGNKLIWVTPKADDEPAGPPLEIRFYNLRKGMVGSELGQSLQGMTPFAGAQSNSRGGGQQQQQQQPREQQDGTIGLLDYIERMVPQPDGADFIFNDKAHVLIVKNTRENLELVEKGIDKLDVRPLQVLIEARFITTAVSDLRDLGIDWLLDSRRYRPSLASGSTADKEAYLLNRMMGNRAFSRLADPAVESGPDALANTMQFTRRALTAAATGGGSDLAYQFILGDTALQATLHALETSGQSKIIVVPRVTTLNNRQANFRVGEDTTYFDDVQTQISSTTGYGNNNSRDSTFNYNRPSTIETGYSLVVTPSVGADLAAINLNLRPEISAVKEWTEYTISTTSYQDQDGTVKQPTIKIPTVTRQYIETEAVIRSGETIVLGGLVNTMKQDSTRGTPWLSRIPFLGFLFKTENKRDEYNNILIFVTATVLSDVGEELIPLNEFERYGLEVPADAKIPDVLKNAQAADAAAQPDAEEAPADEDADAADADAPADDAAADAPAEPAPEEAPAAEAEAAPAPAAPAPVVEAAAPVAAPAEAPAPAPVAEAAP